MHFELEECTSPNISEIFLQTNPKICIFHTDRKCPDQLSSLSLGKMREVTFNPLPDDKF